MTMHGTFPKIEGEAAQTSTGLMPRDTVELIVGYRNKALELYAEAHTAIALASEAVDRAREMWKRAATVTSSYNGHNAEEVKRFSRAVACPDRDEYLRVARRLIDTDVWSWIVTNTQLERLMDKEAKDKLRDQLRYIPDEPKRDRYGHRIQNEVITSEEAGRGMPPVTVENVYATLEQFQMDAGMIFRRGIANAFSKLDRRFRSHDGFKVGGRVILYRCFGDSGRWNYHSNEKDTLMDIERTFAILDGKTVTHNYASTIGAIDRERSGRWAPSQSLIETEYFRIRIFKNGNAHLWMLRDDLVVKVNKLLAEHYGEAVGDGMTQEPDPLDDPKLTPARYYGFFPTPDDAALSVMSAIGLYRKRGEAPLRILEPSAGTGNLARHCTAEQSGREGYGDAAQDYTYRAKVDCVEIQPQLAELLRLEGIYNRVYAQDFLALAPETTGLYDRIVMNPPFDRDRDIDHVVHALKFLAPGGTLTAIMSAGTEYRHTAKALAFRKLMVERGASYCDLPAGSFAECGTNTNTIIVQVGGTPSYGYRNRWERCWLD